MLFLIHIPKTGGTSLRLGAQWAFGGDRVLGDYGKDSSETAALIRAYLYDGAPDFWAWYSRACRDEVALVTGHVGANRFVSTVGIGNTLCMFRDPLERTWSEYLHFVRNYGWTRSFREFYQRDVMRDRQTRLLQGVPMEGLGGIGVTERFSESLGVMRYSAGFDVSELRANDGKEKHSARDALEGEEIQVFERENERDRELYERVWQLVDQEVKLRRDGMRVAKARLQEAIPGKVAGWAWWTGSCDEAVEVEVLVNGDVRGSALAKDLRPGLCRHRPPRAGHVGFVVRAECHARDRVQCRVAETGQLFPREGAVVDESQ